MGENSVVRQKGPRLPASSAGAAGFGRTTRSPQSESVVKINAIKTVAAVECRRRRGNRTHESVLSRSRLLAEEERSRGTPNSDDTDEYGRAIQNLQDVDRLLAYSNCVTSSTISRHVRALSSASGLRPLVGGLRSRRRIRCRRSKGRRCDGQSAIRVGWTSSILAAARVGTPCGLRARALA